MAELQLVARSQWKPCSNSSVTEAAAIEAATRGEAEAEAIAALRAEAVFSNSLSR